MSKGYQVRVWIEDVILSADSPEQAEDKAIDLITELLSPINVLVELAEVQYEL